MSAFESIKKGLEEAKAFSKEQGANAAVHEFIVPQIDVSEIRAQTGLSQAEFVPSIGVAKGTLLNWEHGRRTPLRMQGTNRRGRGPDRHRHKTGPEIEQEPSPPMEWKLQGREG
jgi:putative transcriptional regulator